MASFTVADASESLDVAHHASPRPISAIGTFSDLISLMNSEQTSTEPSFIAAQDTRTTSRSKSPSVDPVVFPTEILLSIFDFVFETCVDWDHTGTVCPKRATAWLEDDPLSPSLFPYSLACVCVKWLHILSNVAVYWTRQVIIVDSHATLPIAIHATLRWVGDLPLQLIVTRHPGISGETDRDKCARVRAVLDLLLPRIHQIWFVTFNARYRSSLPAFWREQRDAQYPTMPGPMNNCSDPGSVAGRSRLPEFYHPDSCDEYATLLRGRFLEEVMLDGGHSFNDLLMLREQHNPWFRNVTFLTVRGYTTSHTIRISLHQFATAIQSCGLLQNLTVENITFVNDLHPSQRFHLEASVVCLHNITDGGAVGNIMSQTLGIRLKEVITVADCPFDGFGKRSSLRTRISSTHLILERLSSSPAAIQQLVCFWNGDILSLVNCPGVSASFLLGVPTEETPSYLRRLRIVDCENASAGGLMALVKSREIQSAIDALFLDGAGDESCVALAELQVHGRGPSISTQQAAWFAKHVDTFSWDTIASDGMRYTWDASACGLIVLPARD